MIYKVVEKYDNVKKNIYQINHVKRLTITYITDTVGDEDWTDTLCIDVY